ncbi:MAG: hypothetical protein R3F36_06670 [Candidatus Competibacteraceae bacterium]
MKQDLAVGAAGGISRLDIENPHGGRLQDGDRLSNTHFQWIAIMFDALSASALRREIIILVLIKIVLLAFLKIAFFSTPPAKGPEEQARHLLGVVAPSVSTAQGQAS